jgi:hypothetical protein
MTADGKLTSDMVTRHGPDPRHPEKTRRQIAAREVPASILPAYAIAPELPNARRVNNRRTSARYTAGIARLHKFTAADRSVAGAPDSCLESQSHQYQARDFARHRASHRQHLLLIRRGLQRSKSFPAESTITSEDIGKALSARPKVLQTKRKCCHFECD